ncbi:tyrosine-type recombinase/integrase [Streptomyces sp. NPDC057011]|uniref:tyrosine-type recombinase/integrase n=1 Tax=unclassified Streptomyces TaxID=2593676 RepID=UPI00364506CD
MPYDNWHLARPPRAAIECPHSSPAECEERHPGVVRCTVKKHGHNKFVSKVHGKGKRWQARWRDPAGVQESELFTTEVDAKNYEDKMRAGVTAGTHVSPKAGKVLMGALVDTWLEVKRFKNPRSKYQIESRTRVHIKDHKIGSMEIADISNFTILWWIKDRSGVIDETYVGLILSEMQSMFDLAVDAKLIPSNPVRTFSVKQAKPHRSKTAAKGLPLTWEQTEKIRIELPDPYKAIVDVGRGLGLRQGEIFGLSPDDILWDHPDGPMLHVQRQIAWDGSVMVFDGAKGEDDRNPKDRWIELGEDVANALLEHMATYPPVTVTLPHATRDGEPVTVSIIFYSREKKPINKNYFGYLWKAALEAIGVIRALNDKPVGKGRKWEKCRDKMMHALRHLFASMMVDAGVDVCTLADRLGHTDPAFTLRKYVKPVATAGDKVRAAVRSMYATAA